MFPTIITYFPLRFRFCDARRLRRRSLIPTDILFMFCLLISLFLSEPPQPKTKRTAITIIVRLFVVVSFVHILPACLHSYQHTHEQKEVEACFVFDNVISFLLVVCKHFISLKSGIFSLVPQLPIALYVYLRIVSNSIYKIYMFFTRFTCIHFRSVFLTHTHTHFRSKLAFANAMPSIQSLIFMCRLTVPFFLVPTTTFDKQSTLIVNTFHIEQK